MHYKKTCRHGASLQSLVPTAAYNRDSRGASRLIEAWPKSNALTEAKAKDLLTALGFAVDKVKKLEDYVINIPDFPKPGIIFRDITSILRDPEGLKLSVHELMHCLEGTEFDVVVGAESRGFLFGMPLAYNKSKGFVPVRKKGKLPRETVSKEYALEYGTAEIEIHKEDIRPGQRIVFVDDLLATGGTAKAAIDLIEELGGVVVKVLFVMELEGLHGRDVLKGYDVESVITYPGK